MERGNKKLLSVAFIADGQLRGCGRYLRFLGFDVQIIENLDQGLSEPGASVRIFLTASRRHYQQWPYSAKYLVKSQTTDEQVREVIHQFSLESHIRFLSRCSLCNTLIQPVEREVVQHLVPEKVFAQIKNFYQCPKCHKIYWEGGHVTRLRDKFRRIGIRVENESSNVKPTNE